MAEKLRIIDIELDGGTQARAGLDEATVVKYTRLVEESQEAGLENGVTIWPFTDPIIVFHDGTNRWLGDGFHRIAACRRAGRYVVEADIRQGTRRDAILFAAGANADHGLPRSDEDKRRSVRRLLEDDEWGQWSDREIARRCRVSPTFVGNIRKELTVHVDSEPEAERVYVTRHGTEATMKTGKIGRASYGDPDELSEPPRLAVWALERHVSAWLDSDSPAAAGFVGDSLEALVAIKEKRAGWRVPFDNIKHDIGLANYTDNDLRQAVNNVINQAEIARRNARDEVQMAGLPALPTNCPECGDDIIIDQKPKPDHIGRAKLEAQCIGCARGLVWIAFVGEGQWTWNHSWRPGETPVRNEEQTAVSIPEGKATPVETATYWLEHYVDPIHNRVWSDLEDNQVHHANSPCAQAFKKQYPDFTDHKALLKQALANLRRKKAAGIAESIKALREVALSLRAQTSSKELAYKLEIVAEDLELAYRIAQGAVETAVSEES